MTRNSLERRKVFLGRLASLSAIAFVVALALLSAACNNVNLAGEEKGSGTVSLAIGDVLTKSVRSAGEPLRQTLATGTTYTVKARLSGGHTAETSITVDSGNLAGAALSFEGIPVGVTVRLDLEVRAGNNLVWIGSTVDDYTVESGENPLTVNVGRVSGVLLWGNPSVSRQILIAPYGSYGSPEKLEYENPADEGIAFCFDNEGNVYVQMGTDKPVNKYKIQQDGTYNATPDALASDESGQYTFSHLSYDNKTGVLYGITDTQIKKLTENGSEQIIDFSNEGITPKGFAVYGESAYVANQSSEDDNGIPSITIVSFDLETPDFALGSGDGFKLPTVFGSQPTYQMIYQEGALYLLLGCVEDSTPNIFSVGAVAKIDAKTLSLDTSFGQGGYLGLVSTKREVSYKDSSGQDQSYSVYAAGTSDEDVFSKPLGFVAIMPKKLVIADAGCIVSEEIVDQGGVSKLKGKAVSRIVTVDLETQSLGFKDLDPNQYYWTGNPLGSSVEISSDTSSAISSGSL